jgi:hypothetical protein
MLENATNKMITNATTKERPSIIFINRCCTNGRKALMEYLKDRDPMPTVKTYGLFNAIDNGLLERFKIDKDRLLDKSYIIENEVGVIEVDN